MTQEEEVSRNYEAFRAALPGILKDHRGRYALMRDARIVEYFDTARDAHAAGRRLYAGQPFSIQEVTEDEADLGDFTHALPGR